MTGAVFEIYLDVYCRAPFLFKGTASCQSRGSDRPRLHDIRGAKVECGHPAPEPYSMDNQ